MADTRLLTGKYFIDTPGVLLKKRKHGFESCSEEE